MHMTILSKIKARSRLASPSLRPKQDNGPLLDFAPKKAPYSLQINIESPPVMIYGLPSESLGYLLSGLLYLTVPDSSMDLAPSKLHSSTPTLSATTSHSSIRSTSSQNLELRTVTLLLLQTITYAKPFLTPSNTLASCDACRKKTTVLKKWNVLTAPTQFAPGRQAFPFSHLLPGTLPPTCVLGAGLGFSVRYELCAEAVGSTKGRLKPANVTLRMPVRVARLVIRALTKSLLRIFPPSNVTVSAQLPHVVHPKSEFTVELRFDGLNDGRKRWRLRKINWRVEECAQVRAHACDMPYHQTKLKVIESSIRLNEEHKVPGSSYVLGTRQEELELEEEEPFLHPQDHENASLHSRAHDTRNSSGRQSTESLSSGQRETPKTKEINELYLQEIRTLEKGVKKEGWKLDYSSTGVIEVPVDIDCRKLSTGLVNHISSIDSRTAPLRIDMALDVGTDANMCCDISDENLGVFVTHTLVLEANLAEEMLQTPAGATLREIGAYKRRSLLSSGLNPVALKETTAPNASAVPTGLTRIFRMKFKMLVTERSGFGISWDEEVPPQYSNVSSFLPPAYGEAVDLIDEDFAELRI